MITQTSDISFFFFIYLRMMVNIPFAMPVLHWFLLIELYVYFWNGDSIRVVPWKFFKNFNKEIKKTEKRRSLNQWSTDNDRTYNVQLKDWKDIFSWILTAFKNLHLVTFVSFNNNSFQLYCNHEFCCIAEWMLNEVTLSVTVLSIQKRPGGDTTYSTDISINRTDQIRAHGLQR